MAAILSMYPGGGTITPPKPITGSMRKAAMVSGPSRWTSSSSSSAQAVWQEGYSFCRGQR